MKESLEGRLLCKSFIEEVLSGETVWVLTEKLFCVETIPRGVRHGLNTECNKDKWGFIANKQREEIHGWKITKKRH